MVQSYDLKTEQSIQQELIQRGTLEMPFSCYHLKKTEKGSMITLPHWHRDIEILFVEQGIIRITVGRETFLTKKGEIVFINPNEIHSILSESDDVEYHAIVFSECLITFPDEHFFQKRITSPLFSGDAVLPRFLSEKEPFYSKIFNDFKKISEINFSGDPEILSFLIHSFSILLKEERIQSVKKNDRRLPAAIKDSMDYIKQHFKEKITLTDLARIAHLSENYYCNCFKECTGLTAFEYLHTVRIEAGRHLRVSTDLSIQEIAAKCGFENVGYFIKIFQKKYYTTPKRYRTELSL